MTIIYIINRNFGYSFCIKIWKMVYNNICMEINVNIGSRDLYSKLVTLNIMS